MVLQTEWHNGGYQQQSYSSYQGPNGRYNTYQGVTEYPSPYSGPFQVSTFPSTLGPHHQSAWSSGGGYYGNGAGNYPGGGLVPPVKPVNTGYGNSYYESPYTHENSNNHGSPHHQGHGSPNYHGGYGSPYNQSGYGSPNHHGHGSPNHHGGYGSPHNYAQDNGTVHTQGHGSPTHHGQGSPHRHDHENIHKQGHGSPYGFGSAVTSKINKLTQGHNNYGSGSPNYGHNPSGFNHGYNNNHQQQPSWIVKGLDDDDE